MPEPGKSFRRYAALILSMDLLQWAYLFVKLMILLGPGSRMFSGCFMIKKLLIVARWGEPK
jgi:hypothetical protein